MLAILYQPLSPGRTFLLTVAVVLGVTLYCLAYTALTGVAESPVEGILWASVNVVPFLLAFEALKRVTRFTHQGLVLAGALAVSVGLDALFFESGTLGFEIVRRLPSVALVFLLARTGPLIAARRLRATAQAQVGPLPLPPGDIDWVAAAGNYVELHAGQRTVLHRASLATVEALLAPHGFVRIHRSRLVARRAVARVRATDIILHDGVSLTIGARYRAQLQASIDSKSRPFVPKRWHLSGERSDRSASQRTREDEDDTRDSDRTDGNGAADAGGGRQTGNSDRRPDPEGDHAA